METIEINESLAFLLKGFAEQHLPIFILYASQYDWSQSEIEEMLQNMTRMYYNEYDGDLDPYL